MLVSGRVDCDAGGTTEEEEEEDKEELKLLRWR